ADTCVAGGPHCVRKSFRLSGREHSDGHLARRHADRLAVRRRARFGLAPARTGGSLRVGAGCRAGLSRRGVSDRAMIAGPALVGRVATRLSWAHHPAGLLASSMMLTPSLALGPACSRPNSFRTNLSLRYSRPMLPDALQIRFVKQKWETVPQVSGAATARRQRQPRALRDRGSRRRASTRPLVAPVHH